MGFSCSSDGDIYPEFHHRSERKAAKTHICVACRHEIQPGEHYTHEVGKWDGIIAVTRTCERCSDLISSFQELGFSAGGDSFFDDLADYFDEDTKQFDAAGNRIHGRDRADAIRIKHRDWKPA